MPDDYDLTLPRNPAIEAQLRDIGRTLKSVMPPGWGFTLAMFEYEGRGFFYLSSADRESMIKTLQGFLDDQRKRAGA